MEIKHMYRTSACCYTWWKTSTWRFMSISVSDILPPECLGVSWENTLCICLWSQRLGGGGRKQHDQKLKVALWVAQVSNPSPWDLQRQTDLSEVQASLAYVASSRIARSMKLDLVSERDGKWGWGINTSAHMHRDVIFPSRSRVWFYMNDSPFFLMTGQYFIEWVYHNLYDQRGYLIYIMT